MENVEFLVGDAKEKLQELPADHAQTAITSPPYFGLRDYEKENQIGLEESIDDFIENLCNIIDETGRVLRLDGTFWLNMGDTYHTGNIESGDIKPKDQCLVPHRVAIELQRRGWYVRSTVIWHRTTAPPESVKDRPTNAHEYFFLLSQNRKYFYDHFAVKEPMKTGAEGSLKNKRDVWPIPGASFGGDHFACVDEETEILTKDGWKAYNEVSTKNKVATFNTKTEKLEYQFPNNIHRYHYDGELVKIENNWVDQFVTPNHRVLKKSKRCPRRSDGSRYLKLDEDWEYEEAQNLKARSGLRIPNSGKYNGDLELSKEKAELLGWIITEGIVNRSKSIRIYQSKSANPEKVSRIRMLLQEASQNFKERTRFRETKLGSQLECHFALNKTMNDNSWVWEWLKEDLTPKWNLLHVSQECLKAVYEGIVKGDGYKREDGRHSFIQHDKYTREWFVVLATHLGKRVTHTPEKKTVYVTHQNYSNIHSSYFNEVVGGEEYKGVVWCPETPNTNFVARRNKKVFITGNTFPVELVEDPIKASTSKKGQCAECGAPIKRTIEKEGVAYKDAGNRKRAEAPGSEITKGHNSVFQEGVIQSEKTSGWKPTCDCDTEETEPQVVLDPFCGSGTTGIGALKHGRRFVGIDLNEEFIDIAKERIQNHEDVPANHSFW